MTPVEALDRIVYLLDRALEPGFRVNAFKKAADVARKTPPEELAARAAAGTLTELPAIGDASAKVITEALHGEIPGYVTKLEATTQIAVSDEATAIRRMLKGDCHSHTNWSDGGADIETMARAAIALGHEWWVLTDHSPRLTIAHGLNRDRLSAQLDEIERLNRELAPFRIFTGLEVDILEDGALDMDDDMLERLDLVVASVHSKLKMDRQPMTERMVLAAASPHVDIIGHCTGRMIDKRPPSSFDADIVFAACAQFGTAVEINCRPERLDPPDELLQLALDYGCYVAIDSDAHAPGQLEWQPYGCEIAARNDVPLDLIINTFDADGLLSWTTAAP
ncbi:MAG: PHP domain-containing protein [Acidimicrobiia bacterium]